MFVTNVELSLSCTVNHQALHGQRPSVHPIPFYLDHLPPPLDPLCLKAKPRGELDYWSADLLSPPSVGAVVGGN